MDSAHIQFLVLAIILFTLLSVAWQVKNSIELWRSARNEQEKATKCETGRFLPSKVRGCPNCQQSILLKQLLVTTLAKKDSITCTRCGTRLRMKPLRRTRVLIALLLILPLVALSDANNLLGWRMRLWFFLIGVVMAFAALVCLCSNIELEASKEQ